MRDLYDFQAVTLADVGMLSEWQTKPHVRDWWDSDGPLDAEALADARVARWVVRYDGHPFAYMQDYTVHGWHEHHFAHLPRGARGIDQYIGDAEMIGQGHGQRFIRQRVEVLFAQGAPSVATDPHPDNARAIAAYKKAGFAPIGAPMDTAWGLILPMVVTA